MQPAVWLFDIDGVLVRPGGYRAAVRATVNYFSNQMGWGDQAPADDIIAIYEAQGITCEWDMVPLTLAIMLEAAGQTLPDLPLDTIEDAKHALAARRQPLPPVDFAARFRALGRYVRAGQAPAESVLAACQPGSQDAPFPRLAGQGLLRELLCNTRRPALSPTTHLFETFALGNDLFSSSLGLAARVSSESLLLRHDQPLLEPAARDQVLAWVAEDRVRPAAYTARPSRPLFASDEQLAVYTPEAELALELVGLAGIPLVGSGQVGEAARRLGESEDRLVKPAPYHALAALAAAILQDRVEAMAWTGQVFLHVERGGVRPASAFLPEALDLHVFEDSPTGMAGARHAAELLARLACKTRLHLWGVSTHPEKAAALEQQGARVSADINQAVRLAGAVG